MKKATHDGTCQVCGRMQALPAGIIAKHGYTVEHHFFNGICPGASHLPLEVERTFADEVAAGLLRDAADADKQLALVQAGKAFPRYASAGFSVRDRWNKWADVEVLFADAEEGEQRRAVEQLAYALESRAKLARSISAGITKRADTITGKQELQPRVAEGKREIVAGMTVKIYGAVRKVVAIESQVAWGCGPHLNGHTMPHAIFVREDGKRYGIPVRLIRQAAIVD